MTLYHGSFLILGLPYLNSCFLEPRAFSRPRCLRQTRPCFNPSKSWRYTFRFVFFFFTSFRLAESVTAGRGVVLPGLPYTSSRNRSLAQCRDFNIHIDHASRTFWQPGEFACVFPRIHTSVAILVVYLFFFLSFVLATRSSRTGTCRVACFTRITFTRRRRRRFDIASR